MSSYIVPFSQIDTNDRLISKPILMLAEVYNKGADVVPGFCLDYRAFRDFVNKNQLHQLIKHATSNIDKKNQSQLGKSLEHVIKAFLVKPFPFELSQELEKVMGDLWRNGHVVSPRVTYPDLPHNFLTLPPSQPNQYKKNENQIKEIWAQIVFKSALLPKSSQSLKNFCLLFQLLEPTEISINAYSKHPVESLENIRYLEAWWGWNLTDQSQVPEMYFVKKETCYIERLSLNHQTHQIELVDHKLESTTVANHLIDTPKLTERLIRQICTQIKSIEDHYQMQVKVNFGYVRGKLYLHSILPLTLATASNLTSKKLENKISQIKTHDPILIGKTAYPGRVSGRVLFLQKPSDYQKITKNHICVANQIDMRYLNQLKDCSGLICAQFGQHSPASILSREWKIPCLIGVEKPKTKLTNNQIITLDTRSGCVFSGSGVNTHFSPNYNKNLLDITQKIGIEIDDPYILPSLSGKSFNGDVFITTDRIIQTYTGVHPEQISFVKFRNLYEPALEKILDSFHSNTAIIMTNKLNMSSLRKLKYGSKHEAKIKDNSNLLFGPSRYIKDPKLFKRELKIISKLSKERYSQDIKVCVPSIRTKAEFEFVYKWIEYYDLLDRFLISIDINSTIFILDDLFQMASFDIVIDLPSLAKQLVVRDRLDSDLIHQSDPAGLGMVLEIMKFSANRRGISALLRTGSLTFGPDQLKVLADLDLEEIILEGNF